MSTPAPGPYYDTIPELVAAIKYGEIGRAKFHSEGGTVYATADAGNGEARVVFESDLTPEVRAMMLALGVQPGAL